MGELSLIDSKCTEILTFGRQLMEAKIYVSKHINDFLLGADAVKKLGVTPSDFCNHQIQVKNSVHWVQL